MEILISNHRKVNILTQEELETKINNYKPKEYGTTEANKWFVELADAVINKFRFDNNYL